ncbi:MAG: hypothetical protein JW757_05210 [Anaerolineales bacterium]|nr:hypothetical protein [Anaerolineales bacterium]
MVLATFSLKQDYWETITIIDEDIEVIYDHLLEIETPMSAESLVEILVEQRLVRERKDAERKKSEGDKIYLPKEQFSVGDKVTFPSQEWASGKVTNVRPARSPIEETFKVIEVEFEDGLTRQFASELEDHQLNTPAEVDENDPLLSPSAVIAHFGGGIIEKLKASLNEHPDFVYIAGKWFPSALLVEVNAGNLNLAEAILDMNGGGPLPTPEILKQVEMPEGVNNNLAEFSLDLALQEDPRFDEVGSAGQVSWFLKRIEPEDVQKTPLMLKSNNLEYAPELLTDQMWSLVKQLDDELSEIKWTEKKQLEEVTVTLIFPHWRTGTLPLTDRLSSFFPTAYESPRVRFKIIDGDTGEEFPGWVVRLEKYVYGLREWYLEKGIMPGGKIVLQRSTNPGEVIVRTESHRSAKEWVRTALIGADGGVVYAMLKQPVSTMYDDWMMVTMPADTGPLDQAWQKRAKSPVPFEQIVVDTLRELAKLNPQLHVHAAELYSALNVVYRCPPEPLLALLSSRPWFVHVGDLHFRYDGAAGN